MLQFSLGVLSSVVATILIYIFRFNIGILINWIFRRYFAEVSGDYIVHSYSYEFFEGYSFEDEETGQLLVTLDDPKNEGEDQTLLLPNRGDFPGLINLNNLHKGTDTWYSKASIKQFANRISGTIITWDEGKETQRMTFNGKISPSRIVTLSSEEITDRHHNFGTMLLKISSRGDYLHGRWNALCADCQEIGSSDIIFERI